MQKITSLLTVLMFTGWIGAASAQTITVNVNGLTQASIDGSVGEDVFLTAGTYQLSFIEDTYTAFIRFADISGCINAAGCAKGWENSVLYTINQDNFTFGDGSALGSIGPISGGGYFETAAGSLANAAGYAQNFTLAADTTVRFWIGDDILFDNQGGISLSVMTIPLPAAGDLNGDGIVDLHDVWLGLQIVSGELALEQGQLSRGDVAPIVGGVPSPDGSFGIEDVLVILQKVLGMRNF